MVLVGIDYRCLVLISYYYNGLQFCHQVFEIVKGESLTTHEYPLSTVQVFINEILLMIENIGIRNGGDRSFL